MAEDDDESGAEPLGRELDAADLGGRDDVAGDPDDEQIAQSLVEDDLDRHTRVRASEDDGERRLPRHELVAARRAGQGLEAADTDDETQVSRT